MLLLEESYELLLNRTHATAIPTSDVITSVIVVIEDLNTGDDNNVEIMGTVEEIRLSLTEITPEKKFDMFPEVLR